MRWLVLSLFAVSCGPLTPKPAAAPKAAKEGDETGVKGIARLLRDSRQARDTKQFEEATRLMRKAELAVADASEVTRSHPDFEDVEETVKREHEYLEQAIEKDRIERRNAAIDDLMRKGELALRQAATLYQELKVRVPTESDVQTYLELVSTLAQLRADGKEFLNEPRYKTHADDRDQRLIAHDARSKQARWQVDATDALRPSLEAAQSALAKAQAAATTPERVAALEQVATAFAACNSVVAELRETPPYRDNLLVETRLGTLPVADTRKQCMERSSQARLEADRIDWQEKVQGVVSQLTQALAALKSARKASEALAASQSAIAALRACQVGLQPLTRHPGHDGRRTYSTTLGVLTQTRLESACASEETRLTQGQPALAWRADFEAQVDRLAEAKTQLDVAATAREVPARLKAWQAGVGGLKECVERLGSLAKGQAAQRNLALDTAFGRLTVSGLLKDCGKRLVQAEKQLAAAAKASDLQTFLTTCKGDEVAVAEREGIPDRIDPVEGGRVFVYERKRGKGLTHFGFDGDGKRVDFRVRWLDLMSGLVAEVNRVVQAAQTAKSGAEALKATQDALPILDVCMETVERSQSSPGFDAKTTFATALGKLAAGRLKQACQSEMERRSRALVGLRWRSRLEELRDRVGAASAELGQAKAAAAVEPRAKHLGVALGGYSECVERAQALAGEEGADKRLKVKTAHGNLDVKGMERTCQAQLKELQKELARAGAARALEEFVAGCKGDEIEVARRRGVPARLESLGDGRVFVYEGGRGQRFAFDADGKRLDEKAFKSK